MATARLLEDIAFQMSASIQAAITGYTREVGVDNNPSQAGQSPES